jgi:hypothetical protein
MLLSGNPIIKNKYTSDPTALVYNDEVYLYTGHDEAPPGAVLTAYGLAILLVRRIKGKAQPCFLFDKNYMVLFSLHAAVSCMTKTYLLIEKTANPLFYQNDYIDQIREHFFKAQPYSSLGEFVEESSLLCLSDLE